MWILFRMGYESMRPRGVTGAEPDHAPDTDLKRIHHALGLPPSSGCSIPRLPCHRRGLGTLRSLDPGRGRGRLVRTSWAARASSGRERRARRGTCGRCVQQGRELRHYPPLRRRLPRLWHGDVLIRLSESGPCGPLPRSLWATTLLCGDANPAVAWGRLDPTVRVRSLWATRQVIVGV